MRIITSAIAVGLLLVSATAAQACRPERPMTDAELAAAQLDRQARAFDAASMIMEAEVVRSWHARPAEARPPHDGDTHVVLRPIRNLRGDAQVGDLEFVHQRHCGYAMAYSVEPGTRVLLYSNRGPVARPEDALDIIPVTDITHGPTIQALGRQ